MAKKTRLDQFLLLNGLASSRNQAQQLIRAGMVRDKNGQLLDKPGQEVADTIEVQIKQAPRFVSRGGEKLLEAFKKFDIQIGGRICLDCGISTGGFTDCLLQHGAARVYGIDVGYGQIAWKLRQDPRVVLFERTNLRTLAPEEVYGSDRNPSDFVVADLSFISLKLVLKSITNLVKAKQSEGVLLVKPQFEVGRERIAKKGVVKDPSAHIDALNGVIDASKLNGWFPKGLIASPITGPAGNHEYLLWVGNHREFNGLPDVGQLVLETLA